MVEPVELPQRERRSCLTCRHWGREEIAAEGDILGTCRVLPPQRGRILIDILEGRSGEARGVWPWTSLEDWCGRYFPHDHSPKVIYRGPIASLLDDGGKDAS